MTKFEPTETQQNLATALIAVIDALETHERKLRADAIANPKPIRATAFSFMDVEGLRASIDRGDDYKHDPVGTVLRSGIRKIGKLMVKNSKTFSEMESLCDLCAGEGPNATWRAVIIDKNWDSLNMPDGGIWAS